MDWKSLPVVRQDRLVFEDTSGPPRPNSIVPCLICTNPFLMLPFIGEPDQLCPECCLKYADTAKVICCRCRPPVTICRLYPKRLDNGFVVQRGAVLHSSACNICQPGLTESTIVEIVEWERTSRPRKIILPGNPDYAIPPTRKQR